PAWEAGILPLNYARGVGGMCAHIPPTVNRSLLMVAPRRDRGSGRFQLEIKALIGLNRGDVYRLRRDDVALQVHELEDELERRIRCRPRILDVPLHLSAGVGRIELRDGDIA